MAVRKKFQEVEIPILNETASVLGTPENLNKKTIKLDLSRKLRGKSLELTLKIYNKGKLIAYPKKLLLMKFYIIRMMRKRASYVEESIQIQCQDIKAIIKPFLITRKKVSRAIRNHLRTETKQFLTEYVKEKDYLDVCNKILDGELQKTLLPKLKKIYPLSFCEIRIFETKELDKAIENIKVKKTKPSEEEKPVEEEPKPKEAKIEKPKKEKAVKKTAKEKK